ncbi:uncharacterized protein LOC120698024 isoform X2 [Panicum virgatum]|uniref:Uncharacterized protein n=1 Tax=Panicum virgatum TaxID=38727 RepID=A0A8T0UVW3_PANVG|nr:uncharacterized protein LOC120698024 isoform X2 [Panicum virgatum]KAG2626195.1 hypothetical protein PVAP13_3KG328000 [Panicum virgatum]
MQKSLGAKSTARRRPLRVVSVNKARPAPQSLLRKPPPPAPAAADADAALDRLLRARSDLAGIVSQIDRLISDALRYQTVSQRGKQEIQSFNGFLSETNYSLKQWSSRLKKALETGPENTENVSKHNPGTCSDSVAKRDGKLICSSSNLPDTDPVASPCSNFTEADMTVSPSPLVSWRTGACMVDSGKQLFLLTPLPKTKACSSRCPTTKTQMKIASSMDQLDLPSLPVWKLTISDDDRPDQGVKVKEARTGTIMTPHVSTENKCSLEDMLCSPRTFSIQKSMGALPRSCLKTTLSSKHQLFSPIPEGSRKEDIDSNGPSQGDKRSESSDEVSKDLASRYDIYGLQQSTKSTYRRREDEDALQWYLSPLKTCVLMDPQDAKPLPTPARSNTKGIYNVPDDKPIQTPAVHSKALLGTHWKDLESTNLKERQAGETTLKKELWTRFEAASTNELHLDKSLFQKMDGKRFLDMLEEAL